MNARKNINANTRLRAAPPVVLRGLSAVADHLGVGAREVQHLHRQRRIPTFHLAGAVIATASALDIYRTLAGGRHA